MRRRALLVILAVIAAAAAVALWVARRNHPPRAVELLPPSEGVVYIDVDLLRKAGVFAHEHPIQRDPEFEDFVRQTGFDFERDLDDAAFALHSPATQGRGDDYPRFSEVFFGRVDVTRSEAYFAKLARSTEQYRNETIYSIPHDGRTVRVAVLDQHTAAASNTESADAIHAILDRWSGENPGTSSAPTLLQRLYGEIPTGSIAWMIAEVETPPGIEPHRPGLALPSWLRDVAGGSEVVASLRFITELQLRAVAIAPSDADAQRIGQNANSWLAVFRTLLGATQTSGTDADVKAAFDSLKVEQNGNRVVLTAGIPARALKKIVAEPTTAEQKPKGKGQSDSR